MIRRALAWLGIGCCEDGVECHPIGPMATSSTHVAVTTSVPRRAITVQPTWRSRLSGQSRWVMRRTSGFQPWLRSLAASGSASPTGPEQIGRHPAGGMGVAGRWRRTALKWSH